tara:strand:+ start:379 stop:792 length:414 start_codon:yes stop_codon:yes gene_type:complete
MKQCSTFKKQNVSKEEYIIHKLVYDYKIANTPRIISYDAPTKEMIMEHLGTDTVAKLYGEDGSNVPDHVFQTIRNIITNLYKNGIMYPDITGYNFMKYDNSIWIIDFGHAQLNPKRHDKFITKFIDGQNRWNWPRFK